MRFSLVLPAALLLACSLAHAQTPVGIDGAPDMGAIMRDNMQNIVKGGVAMTSFSELCGLSTAAESQTALASFREQMVSHGGRTDEVDAIYRQSLRDARAQAAANPQDMKRRCDGMRQMGSPDSLRQLQDLSRALEGLNR